MKKYRATWDETYEVQQTQTVDETFFVEDRGYDTTDVAKIAALKVGEELSLDADHHQIRRIE
ncbi:hypothetical protein [Caballeronia sp. 15711]|uniref:hypothetical protein n=1 Tax=Caballeronia sp. 15711 TaxID=3391029 RepID=UPI0039E399EB